MGGDEWILMCSGRVGDVSGREEKEGKLVGCGGSGIVEGNKLEEVVVAEDCLSVVVGPS